MLVSLVTVACGSTAASHDGEMAPDASDEPTSADASEMGDAAASPDGGALDASASPDAGDTRHEDDAGAGPIETVHLAGRFDTTDPAGPKFDWSGSAISAYFTGTAIAVNLKDDGDNFFEVQIDDSATTRLPTTKGVTHATLATGLPAGEHHVLVHKRTEGRFSTVQFLGLEITGGALVAKAQTPARHMEVIGDSISAGYGNEGVAPCAFSAATENHHSTYGALAARALGAELTTIAWSGHGVVRNVDNGTSNLLPAVWKQTLATAPKPWSFATIPDVVVVNLGTNDFAKGNPGEPFVTGYVAFTTSIRARYPNAWIFVALGPILAGKTARDALNAVVNARRAAGDARIAFIEFPLQSAANGLGCDNHPSLATHAQMATQLTSVIRTTLGW